MNRVDGSQLKCLSRTGAKLPFRMEYALNAPKRISGNSLRVREDESFSFHAFVWTHICGSLLTLQIFHRNPIILEVPNWDEERESAS